jgi:hypothetical protein
LYWRFYPNIVAGDHDHQLQCWDRISSTTSNTNLPYLTFSIGTHSASIGSLNELSDTESTGTPVAKRVHTEDQQDSSFNESLKTEYLQSSPLTSSWELQLRIFVGTWNMQGKGHNSVDDHVRSYKYSFHRVSR